MGETQMVRIDYFPLIFPYRVYLEGAEHFTAYTLSRYGDGGHISDSRAEHAWVIGRGTPPASARAQLGKGHKFNGSWIGFRNRKNATDFYLRHN